MSVKRRVCLVGGSKGGVGKSLLAMTVLDYLRAKPADDGQTLFIETDNSNPDVWKAYRDSVPSALLDLDTADGWLELLNHCADPAYATIVINTAARNNLAVTQFGERLALGLTELDVTLVTLWVINTQLDSLELLKQYRAALPVGELHVVRNEFRGSNFRLYDESDLRRDIEAHGGLSLSMSTLAERVTQELYGRQRMTLDEVATSPNSPFGHRIEAKRWRKVNAPMLDKVLS